MTRSSTFLPLQSSFCFRHQRYDLLSSTRYGVTNLSSNIIKHAAYAYFQLFELVPCLLFPLVSAWTSILRKASWQMYQFIFPLA